MLRAFVAAFLSLASGLWSAAAVFADAPSLSYCAPAAAAPGQSVDITLHGDHLEGAHAVWTNMPAEVVAVERSAKKDQATFRFALPGDAAVGVYGLRVATGEGLSNLRLLMVDDLPSVAEAGDHGHRETAQEILLPAAVDGACDAESFDYYKFTASVGQRISVEVVARRLGSPLDPVVRLLDARGRELAYSDDDPSVAPDARLSYTFADVGQYYLEVRDIRYSGGSDYRYRMRVGDFPLATSCFPLAGRKGTTPRIQFAGHESDSLGTVWVNVPGKMAGDRMALAARYPRGRGTSTVTLLASDTPEQVEIEPNDAIESGSPLSLPGGVNGRFDRAGDRDCFRFEAKKGDRWVFVGAARRFGSPSDLFLRIYSADGKRLAEAEDSGGGEGKIDFKTPADGSYCLSVEDLHGRGGPEFVYRVAAASYRPGFELEVAADKFDVPRGGVFTTKVTCKRDGYNGPIQLAIEGVEGLQLAGDVIAEKKNDTTLRVTVPPSIAQGKPLVMRIVGRAKIGDAEQVAVASTAEALKTLFAGLAHPPAELDGSIGLGVGPPFADFFELSVEPERITLPQLLGTAQFEVKAKRLNKFDDKIKLAVEGLPDGVTAKVSEIDKGKEGATIELSGPLAMAEGDYTFRVTGSAEYQDQPKRVVCDGVKLRAIKPLELRVTAAGPLVTGGKQTLRVRIVRNVEPTAPLHLSLAHGPDGVGAPEAIEVPADRNEVELEVTAGEKVRPGKFDLVVAAEATYGEKTIHVESGPAVVSVVRR